MSWTHSPHHGPFDIALLFMRTGRACFVPLVTLCSCIVVLSAFAQVAAATADHKPYNDGERARIEKAGGVVSMKRVDGDLAVVRACSLRGAIRPVFCVAVGVYDRRLVFPPLATMKAIPKR